MANLKHVVIMKKCTMNEKKAKSVGDHDLHSSTIKWVEESKLKGIEGRRNRLWTCDVRIGRGESKQANRRMCVQRVGEINR